MTLYEKTHELLDTRSNKITFEIIANETGLSITWLNYFLHKRIKEPSIHKVEVLYAYLNGEGLDL